MWEYASNHPVWFIVFCIVIVSGIASIVKDVTSIFTNRD